MTAVLHQGLMVLRALQSIRQSVPWKPKWTAENKYYYFHCSDGKLSLREIKWPAYGPVSDVLQS